MQRAFGTKKKMLAATQRPTEDGPDAAANAIHRGERIAATFMRTRSRVPSWRRSPSIAAIIESRGQVLTCTRSSE
jgi:hypothetical protein